MPKNNLRQKMLTLRRILPVSQRAFQSHDIQKRFMDSALFQDARCLGLYAPIHGEVETGGILAAALQGGKKVVFPRVTDDGGLELVEVRDPADFREGAFGVREPLGQGCTPLDEVDLLAVPGVAFDARGGRLGYGKGYFDRLLRCRGVRPATVGLCYEIQLVAFLPKETHDVLMDALVTERRWLRVEKRV